MRIRAQDDRRKWRITVTQALSHADICVVATTKSITTTAAVRNATNTPQQQKTQ